MTSTPPPIETIVVGFLTTGCVPMHLRTLILSGRQFIFVGSRELYKMAVAELDDKEAVQTVFADAGLQGVDNQMRWIDGLLSQFPGVRDIFFMEIERFRKCILPSRLKQDFPNLSKLKIRGNLFPWTCLLYRSTRQDYVSWLKWQFWAVAVRRCVDPGSILIIDTEFKRLFPLCRFVPGGFKPFKVCPEPYDRTLVKNTLDVPTDADPPSILFFGHHTWRKGTHWALKSLATYRRPLKVIIAGQCEDEAEVRRLCQALPANVKSDLLLYRINDREKEEVFKRASVIVLPYEIYLGSSGLVFEALIYRRKILASHVCAIDPRLLKSGTSAIYRRGDSQDFSARLEALLDVQPDWNQAEAFLAEHGIQTFAEAVLPAKNTQLNDSNSKI